MGATPASSRQLRLHLSDDFVKRYSMRWQLIDKLLCKSSSTIRWLHGRGGRGWCVSFRSPDCFIADVWSWPINISSCKLPKERTEESENLPCWANSTRNKASSGTSLWPLQWPGRGPNSRKPSLPYLFVKRYSMRWQVIEKSPPCHR